MTEKEKSKTADQFVRMCAAGLSGTGFHHIIIAVSMEQKRIAESMSGDSGAILFGIYKFLVDQGDAKLADDVARSAMSAKCKIENKEVEDEADRMFNDLDLN